MWGGLPRSWGTTSTSWMGLNAGLKNRSSSAPVGALRACAAE